MKYELKEPRIFKVDLGVKSECLLKVPSSFACISL